MTSSIVKINRTSGSIGRPSVAPGPSGGTYFAEGSDSTGIAHIARIDSLGALVWTKEITISAATTANGVTPTIYSSSDHLAVVLRYFETAGSVYKASVVLYLADGTLVWEKTVPVSIAHRPSIEDSVSTTAGVTGLVLAEDESVYLTGMVSSDTQLALVKLNGSDGSLAWTVNLYPSTGARTGDFNTELGLLSGGDVIATFYGADGTYLNDRTYIQRVSAADGSVVWTRKVIWANGDVSSGGAIGVDPSDNIYIGYPQAGSSSYPTVLKLDSSGATLWLRSIQDATSLFGATRLSATADGVYMATGQSATQNHYFFPAAGTTGAGLGVKASYAASGGTAAFETHGGQAAGSQLLMAASYTAASVANAAVILSDYTTTADNGLWGGLYTRSTSTFTIAAGSGTIVVSTPSYARGTAPSITLASSSITSSSGGLTATNLVQPSNATGLASTVAFGLPEMQGVQRPYTISTAFGAATHIRGLYATGAAAATAFGLPRSGVSYAATGLLNTTLFGLPVYSANRTCGATGIASTLGIGTPFSIRGGAPAPIGYASSLDPSTAFGTATATTTLNGAATGFSSTAFGLPVNRLGLAATTLDPATEFGAANAQVHANAQGLASTTFGTPKVECLGYAASLSSTAAFGLPALSNVYLCAATGWSDTAFGTPVTQWPTRTRSAKFRTQFGQAQAERTLP